MTEPLDVAALLDSRRQEVLEAAGCRVEGTRSSHYAAAGKAVTEERLRALLDVAIDACRSHRLDGAVSYAEHLAQQRQSSGYPLAEVQTAINALEEAIWRSITVNVPAEAQAYALGLVATVLGAIKDKVAVAYLAGIGSPIHTLRVENLFAGSEGLGFPG